MSKLPNLYIWIQKLKHLCVGRKFSWSWTYTEHILSAGVYSFISFLVNSNTCWVHIIIVQAKTFTAVFYLSNKWCAAIHILQHRSLLQRTEVSCLRSHKIYLVWGSDHLTQSYKRICISGSSYLTWNMS